MRTPARFLHSTAPAPASPSSAPISIDSNMVVILASLLCALISVAGLALVARCACRRARHQLIAAAASSISSSAASPLPPRGLNKKAIDALPVTAFAAAGGDCAICLADFAAGEELRELPRCGHGFHVACIDTWLGAHVTCPSCRATIGGSSSPPPLPDRRCRTCGATCDDVGVAAAAASARDESSFLP